MASKLAQQLKVIGMAPKAPGLPYVVTSEITPKDKLALQKALLSCLKGTTFQIYGFTSGSSLLSIFT